MFERLKVTRSARPLVFLAVTLLLLSLSPGIAQQGWEMRVCAAPFNPPMSSREDGGFNNRIAEILADELGAHVTYEWVRLDSQNVERTLLSGACDMIVGIAEGASNVLSTVAYLRAPYVFVTREDADIEIESINDPILEDLRIGTYQYGIPAHVLDSLGISDNVIGYPPVGTPGGSDLELAALNALAEGEVDVAILYGPPAAAFDDANPVDLELDPVTPEVIPGESLIVMSRTWTIGVRPGDEALRDRLNIALAARWEEVRAAVDEFGVPQAEIPPPFIGDVERQPGTGIGVIVPGRTGGMVSQVVEGEAARRGAILAETVRSGTEFADSPSYVLHANAPTDEAAVRAAERLIATEGVGALAGGFGHDQAASLSEIAEEAGVLFFNIASTATDLRQQCASTTFHVEASSAMLADAAIDWYADEGIDSWFVVHEESPAGQSLFDHLERKLSSEGEAGLVGAATAEPSQFLYVDIVERAIESGAEGVLLALAPADQELFLSQYPQQEDAAPLVLIPRSAAQTREFVRRFFDVSDVAGARVRPAIWDAALVDGAGELNEAYLSRNAGPMNPTAWTSFAAVMIFHQAIAVNADRSAESLTAYLTAPETSFELGKGIELSFRAWSHQLRQPIYLIRPDAEAKWSIEPRDQAEFAEIAGQRPTTDEGSSLDDLGIPEEASECT